MVPALYMMPLLRELGVVGLGLTVLDFVVELRRLQTRVVLQFPEHGPVLRRCGLALNPQQVNVGAGRKGLSPFQPVGRGEFLRVLLGMEHHNELPGNVPLGIHIGCAEKGQREHPTGAIQLQKHGLKVLGSWRESTRHRTHNLHPLSKVAPRSPQNRVSNRSMT